ncbi:MAG: type II secretion system F family protein [Nitrososphaerota archaeon]|nr:type II secretion system F family protein [Nitrososphaerota archaeon]
MSAQKSVAVTKKKPPAEKLGSLDRLSSFTFRAFRGPSTSLARKMPGMRDAIMKSNLRLTPEALVSLAIFGTVIAAVAAAAVIVVGVLLHLLLLLVVAVAPPLVLIMALNSPKMSQSSRSYALENELPFVMGFMQVLAGSGVSVISAMKKISNLTNIFPAASKEAKRILVDVEVFGMDPISALTTAAKTNPNKTFTEFLYGYTTILKTGGDVANYMFIKMREMFDRKNAKMKRTADTIGTLAEAYVTVTSVLGISLFMLYEVQAVVSHNDAGLQSIFLFAFLIVPLISVVFLWLLDGLQSKQPFVDTRTFKVFAGSALAGVVIFFIPVPIKLFMHVGLSLIAMVLPPAILAIKYSREKASIEGSLPDFIRDVSEGRKIGLSPESSIEQLSTKNYGLLSKPVTKMGSQLSWGLPLEKVVSSFVGQVHSWLAKVVGVLMLEVVDAGGGVVQSFSDLADFTRKIEDFETDMKASLKPYVMVIYMAGLMLVVTTFLMVYLMTQPALGSVSPGSPGSPTVSATTIEELLVATIFESWVVGFVAGKMGTGTVSSGFVHACILVAMAVAAILVSGLFIHIPM